MLLGTHLQAIPLLKELRKSYEKIVFIGANIIFNEGKKSFNRESCLQIMCSAFYVFFRYSYD